MAVAKKKTAQKKTVKKKAVAKKKTVKTKSTAKKTTKKSSVKKTTAKKAAVKKKTTTKKAAPKKAAAKKKAPAKKQPARKKSAMEVGTFTPYEEKRGEEYMNAEQIAHFRSILESWKRDLLEEMERTVHHMQDEAANFPDPNDRASQESEFALELRTRDRERKLIKKIDESLLLLETGEYGYCEVCGVEIGIRRLEARPTATLCIDCKTLDEIREKQSWG